MIKNIKDFCIGVAASLFATFLTSYSSYFIKLDGNITPKDLVGVLVDYKFVIYWIIFFIVITSLRRFNIRRIDKLQAAYPSIAFLGNEYDMRSDTTAFGFNWKGYADITDKNYFTDEVLGVHVGKIEGPFCKNDFRNMKESRTYLGRYKYVCPKCGYKKIHALNTWSLKTEVKDEIESKYRNRSNNAV
ncbi:hypothetical protein P4311_27800 [Bacillus thuringiensis]|nr:hypothetical protein [Bacillus thuringiensis]MRB56233.1 hypothetical protein [Bacillus thuringiensis]